MSVHLEQFKPRRRVSVHGGEGARPVALSADYKDDETAAQTFFAEVQNKMLYAVRRHTAAELVVKRADPKQPNMGLQSFSGTRVRKHDVIVAKNQAPMMYLSSTGCSRSLRWLRISASRDAPSSTG